MPFFKRVCLLPWQSFFMLVQEEIEIINTANATQRKKICFIVFEV
jgi:hypothetical protein